MSFEPRSISGDAGASGEGQSGEFQDYECRGAAFPREEEHVRVKAVNFVECSTDIMIDHFIEQRDKTPPHLRGFLSQHSKEEYKNTGTRLFLAESGLAGYGVRNGELVSVFSLPGAHLGLDVVLDSERHGVTFLECIDVNGKLPALYASIGFMEVERYAWNDALAPIGWDYERWGRPDIVMMRRVVEEKASENVQ